MNEKNTKLLNPVKNIVIPYFIFGIVWILFSDTIASYLLKDHISYQTIQSTKGILFVIVTGIFLYFLLKSNLKELEEKEEKLYKYSRRNRIN